MSNQLEGYLLDPNTFECDDREIWLDRNKAVARAVEIVGKLYESSKLLIRAILEDNYLELQETDPDFHGPRAIISGSNGQCSIYQLKVNQ